jgi:sarcosine oxidase subunit gamma
MTPDMTAQRLSFVETRLKSLNARFEPVGEGLAAVELPGRASFTGGLALVDLSPLPRAGYKGRDTAPWLTGQGLALGAGTNRAYADPSGLRLARLSEGEVLLLGGLDGDRAALDRLDAAWSPAAGLTFAVPRQDSHAWFVVVGEQVAVMLAKLCGVDLRPGKFPEDGIAQTSLAKMSAILVRRSFAGMPAFDILADSASAVYLWDCLTDAMAEFDGATVLGLDALRGLEKSMAPVSGSGISST